MAPSTPAAPPTPAGRRGSHTFLDRRLALELVEATLTRVRGQLLTAGTSCWPAGEHTLVCAAQTLLETERANPGDWTGALAAYFDVAASLTGPDLLTSATWWPVREALTPTARRHLQTRLGENYAAPVAGFRPRDTYRVVPLADLPPPLNPFRCGHRNHFENLLSDRLRRERRGWRRFAAAVGVRQPVGENELRRRASVEFARWLTATSQPNCTWHPGADWALAASWARRCWETSDIADARWSEPAATSWLSTHAPAAVRAAATSLLTDPVVWGGPGWDLGNGQTRYLALTGAGVTHVLISTT